MLLPWLKELDFATIDPVERGEAMAAVALVDGRCHSPRLKTVRVDMQLHKDRLAASAAARVAGRSPSPNRSRSRLSRSAVSPS